jgi:uncharacterized lipoprotein YajG
MQRKGAKMKKLFLIIAALLSGCAHQYWVKDNTNMQSTAADLHDCRVQTHQARDKYSAAELEQPCMIAKGYRLSPRPPKD